ncbi:MAG: alpha/beta hydrolase [Paraburkholderia sp.]|nr:alpha/beta hydrolase [Paraburkholderia sp.]
MNRYPETSIAGAAGVACMLAAALFMPCAESVAASPESGSRAALNKSAERLHAVKVVAPMRLFVSDGSAQGQLALYASADLTQPQPQIVRAVVVVHGKLRNADRYYQTLLRAEAHAGVPADSTLLVAPQFLATLDAAPNQLPADVLRWHGNGWMAGDPAAGPAPVSSYAALDSLLAQLSDHTRFPNLREIVFAGHSGGAQVIQRYALASHGTITDDTNGNPLAIRYLVANPSSYAYFDDERPLENATDHAPPRFARYSGSSCAGFDDWKYGMKNRPPYVATRDPRALEEAYVQRDITYLIGGADDDPAQSALDISCPAEVQGPERLTRARNYYAYLQMRHPSITGQRLDIVPGVGHEESRMLTSACALHVMFGAPGCTQ